MGVEIRLTDRQLPVSPAFVDFLHRYIHQQPHETVWHDQLSEGLMLLDDAVEQHSEAMMNEILANPVGQQAVLRSYEIFTAILTGDVSPLSSFHERYQFICVVGCPRHGGTYLAKQLFRSLGMNADEIPSVIAHDGFPDLPPFNLRQGNNSYTVMMQNMAEYLVMVERFFAHAPLRNGRVVVPKKATKAAYHGAFFHAMLGPQTEYLLTLRHPVSACISSYEKSGGLPADGVFQVRSKIEEWAQRDNQFAGVAAQQILRSDYFDVYLRYWEQYHYQLASSGLAASARRQVVIYGAERMEQQARQFYARFDAAECEEKFHVFDKRLLHAQWRPKAEQAVKRVHAAWQQAGLDFSLQQLMESW